MPTVVFMPISWPQEKFIDYIEALRVRQDFRTVAEMMRAAGLDPSLHTNWRKGKQPTMATLDKLAPVLAVTPTALYVAAGHLTPAQLDRRHENDLTVLPRPIQELFELYQSMTTEASRQYVLDQINFALRGLRASAPEQEKATRPARKRAS